MQNHQQQNSGAWPSCSRSRQLPYAGSASRVHLSHVKYHNPRIQPATLPTWNEHGHRTNYAWSPPTTLPQWPIDRSIVSYDHRKIHANTALVPSSSQDSYLLPWTPSFRTNESQTNYGPSATWNGSVNRSSAYYLQNDQPQQPDSTSVAQSEMLAANGPWTTDHRWRPYCHPTSLQKMNGTNRAWQQGDPSVHQPMNATDRSWQPQSHDSTDQRRIVGQPQPTTCTQSDWAQTSAGSAAYYHQPASCQMPPAIDAVVATRTPADLPNSLQLPDPISTIENVYDHWRSTQPTSVIVTPTPSTVAAARKVDHNKGYTSPRSFRFQKLLRNAREDNSLKHVMEAIERVVNDYVDTSALRAQSEHGRAGDGRPVSADLRNGLSGTDCPTEETPVDYRIHVDVESLDAAATEACTPNVGSESVN